MATVDRETALLTAEEFANRPDSGVAEELERGVVVMSPMPGARHGKVCATFARLLGNHVADHDLGHVMGNDSGVVVERGPDTVRGADVSFYSYDRLPRGDPPAGYPTRPPELVCEVLSPGDRWRDVAAKVGEYLKAGVLIVVVLDPEKRKARVFEVGGELVALGPEDVLRLDAILPGFEVVVGRLFD